MDTRAIDECDRMSFADVPFPEVLGRLAAAGVGEYRADLIGCRKLYRDGGAGTYDAPMPPQTASPVGPAFDEPRVVAAIRAIQRREIGYAEFLRRIAAAGCAGYCVHIAGGKAIYSGRDGDFYVENFPTGAP